MEKYPKVSVCMITYNHEKFIAEAINGVLMQECDFEIELIIANDCSPDQTDEVIQNILENHPRASWIKYIKQEKNIGIMPNFIFSLNQCKGDFVAMCEGDDYWITKDKLQKQVDILESNNNVGLVYTNVKHFKQSTGELIEIIPRYAKERTEVIPLMLKSKFIEFPTTVFRKTVLDKVIGIIKNELENGVIGDTRILLETAQNSEIYFLNEITTVYRILEGSASHPTDIDKYIFALKDTYLCRKTFVERNSLDTKWLSDSVCNMNRGLINSAFVSKKYSDTIKLLKNVLIVEVFKYCSWNVFRRKMKIDILIKLLLSLFGIGFLRQKLR
ncbi:glycosyltransferase family 2 protein [Flavobacterium granuli]|nr:glycosyltransferase [Flavobacterium granuli]